MKNGICLLLWVYCIPSVIFSGETFRASFIVEYETKELKAEVQQSVYDLHIENIHSNEKPTELSVFDDKVAKTQLPNGEYRYTLHTRLPHFRQSGSFKVDGDVSVTITHAVPKVLNRKLVFRDQTGEPVVGMNVRFSIHGDTNTHLVNHGDSVLHQGDAVTNAVGEIEIELRGQTPESFLLNITDKKYSYFNKTFNSSFWDSNEPVVFNIDRLVHNGDIDVSVSNHEGVVPLSDYIKSMYPGRDHYAVLRLDRAGVDPSFLNLTVREDKVPLYGLPDGECTVKSLSVIVYGVNMNYKMVPLDNESGTITVKNNQIVPSPRELQFSTGVTTQ